MGRATLDSDATFKLPAPLHRRVVCPGYLVPPCSDCLVFRLGVTRLQAQGPGGT